MRAFGHFMRTAALPVAAGIVALSVLQPALSGQSDSDAKTSVAILVDVSKSFAPFNRTDQAALEQLQRAIEGSATKKWEPAVSIYWATIGNSGVLAGSSVCGSALFHPRLVTTRHRDEFSTGAQLHAWLVECVRAVVAKSQKPENYTDISGTVALAAENGRRVTGKKVIVIFSDFADDLPAGTRATTFELSGERVVLLYRAQPTDAADGNLLFERLKRWEELLKKSGAKDTCRVSIVGATSNTIASCF